MRCKANASNRNESFTKIQMKTQPIESELCRWPQTKKNKSLNDWNQPDSFRLSYSNSTKLLNVVFWVLYIKGVLFKAQNLRFLHKWLFSCFLPLQWSSFLKNKGSLWSWVEIHFNIFIADGETSSSVAVYLIQYGICDNPCQQRGYHGVMSYCRNFSGMWNNLGSGLPSSLDTATAQLPFQKHNHRELLCWISLLLLLTGGWGRVGWNGDRLLGYLLSFSLNMEMEN